VSSLARGDDGVHSFFTLRAETIAESLIHPDVLEALTAPFAGRRKARRFTVPTLLWLGVFAAANAAMRSMEAILKAACDAIEGSRTLPLERHSLTQSGWSRAKQRLSLGLLRRVWRHWVNTARDLAGDVALFHGLRLVAIDDTAFTVPEALWTVFGSHKGGRGDGPAQGTLQVAYDVCARVPVAFTVGKADSDEKSLNRRLLCQIRALSLFLIDCGFYSIRLFADVRRRGHHFLTRMRSSGRPKLLRRLGPEDGLYEIRPGGSWGELPADVPKRMVVRIVRAHWKGFRPVRLVTSLLDAEAVPRSELLDLYHRRWHVETFFRELTHDVHFEHWHTRTVKGLYVELSFILLYITMVRAHMAEAATRGGVLPGHLRFGDGAQQCERTWARLGKTPPAQHAALLDELITSLSKLEVDIRPGRTFERHTQRRRAASRKRKLETLKDKKDVA
jgi:hypothetical protein